MDRVQVKAMLITTHTQTHKHNTLLHNSHAKDVNGLGREQGKAVLISTHTLTHEHKTFLHNSHAKDVNGLGRE